MITTNSEWLTIFFFSESIVNRYQRLIAQNKKSKIVNLILIILSICLAIFCLASITILQYENYAALIRNDSNFSSNAKALCFLRNNYIDPVSTLISLILIIFYIVLYKRRVFGKTKFKYRNIGLPMITGCWNKNDRLFTCLVYGLISLNVFEILKFNIEGNSNYTKVI